MEGRPRTNPEQDRVLAQGRSSGECQRLKSDIHLSLGVWHSTSITNFPQENLLTEAFSLTILSLTVFILRELLTLSLSSALSVWCGRNLRLHLSIGCPRYNGTGIIWKQRIPALYKPRAYWNILFATKNILHKSGSQLLTSPPT